MNTQACGAVAPLSDGAAPCGLAQNPAPGGTDAPTDVIMPPTAPPHALSIGNASVFATTAVIAPPSPPPPPSPASPPLRLAGGSPGWLVGDVAPRFLASAKFAKMEPMTQANYRRFCRWFAEEYGPWRADNFPPGEILAVARRISIARANSMRRLLRWAHGRGFVGADIWAGMEMPCYEKKVIKYLSPGEAHRFFSAVAKPFRAAFALALFAGLRPFEVVQMQWKNIHFGDELRIVVPAKISKVRKRRVIEAEVLKVFRIAQTGVEIVADRKPGIPEIVWRILEPLRGEPEEFILPTVRRGGIPRDAQTVAHPAWMGERRRAEKVSGVKLSQNIFRPTFLTFLVALRQDLALAAKVAGHASLAMLRDHYDGVEFRESAEDFFEIPRTVRTSHVDVSAAGVAALAGLPLPPAGGAGAAPAIEV